MALFNTGKVVRKTIHSILYLLEIYVFETGG